MKKSHLVATLMIVLVIFMISKQSNKETFFKPTSDLKRFQLDNDFEITKLYVQEAPEFYQTSIYKEKGELTLLKTIDTDKGTTQLCFPTIFGWQVVNFESPLMFTAKSISSFVLDYTRPYADKLSMRFFDFKNNLAYLINKNNELVCCKVGKGEINASWRLKMPSNSVRQISKKASGGNIVVFGTKDIIVIDTANVKIKTAYRFGQNQMISEVIPQENKLFILAVNADGNFDMQKSFPDWYSLYVINLNEDIAMEFTNNERLRNAMYENDSIVVRSNKTFCVIDNSLFTIEIKLSDIHNAGVMEASYDGSARVESDILTFKIGYKEYIFNKSNPLELREIPHNLEAINTIVGGDNWDYYFFEDGYCCGYDVEKGERTWKVKTDKHPSNSSEFGVLFAENEEILYYSKKR